MHAIVAVIHREQHLDEEWFSRFCWDNTNYYERAYRTNSLEESLEQVEEYISYLKKNKQEDHDWYDRVLTELMSKETERERIEFVADQDGYYVDDNNRIYEEYNPNGFCDWFVVGGRWSNLLESYRGEKADTMKLKDFMGFSEPEFNSPYGVVLEYKDEEWLEELGQNGKEWFDILNEARDYSDYEGEDLYITMVDIHQ